MSLLKDNEISKVLDRFLEDVSISKRTGDYLKKLKACIINKLWNETLMNVLYRKQLQLFEKQLDFSQNLELAQFYGDLRSYAVGELKPEGTPGSKEDATGK